MDWQGWYTLFVLVGTVVVLVRDSSRPELIMLAALGLLLLSGIVSPEQAFGGFANPAVLTIASLFVVAEGVRRTEALRFVDRVLFANRRGIGRNLLRLMGTTALLSTVLNNTPIVAMLMPRVQEWSRRTNISASKLLIPLSYAAIIGGMVTLIGTSTNVLVSGMLEASGRPGLGMFELAWVGIPVVLAVIGYFTLIGHRMLPDRLTVRADGCDGLSNCLFEVRVEHPSPLIGKPIRDSGLRSLKEAYLIHIARMGHLIPATPEELVHRGDRLTFVGNVSVLDQLLQMPGLRKAVAWQDEPAYETLPLYEAVVADTSDLVGKTLRDVKFRENYHGVVLGIQRQNARIGSALGRTPIKAGDLLLVEAWNGFDKRWNQNRQEFYLVAPRQAQREIPLAKRMPVAILIFLLMIGAFVAGVVPLATASFIAALAMIGTGCLRGKEARSAVDVTVLVMIGAALGIGQAISASGLAASIAHLITTHAAALGPFAVILAVYAATNLLTEMMTNNAAAVLMVPIALAVSVDTGIEPRALAITVAVAASASFMTPIGYQTNLMVMASGGYTFRDYVRAGYPVTIIVMTIAVSTIYVVWT